ncbi:hypothetical protein [Nostoc punctiforme]|uniref:Uncharacterized protein n=1 Tax=Nostoc punctiforme (strain ATCC 29133 / PCC 73102) TaxID=63737 RepID=B2J6E3_NOSP7|nr:hypothetical protein [Nostoc punctiforme]ACC82348.1 conserved hypothetical protein [Nostoc punctiforme PCC 73102]
MKPIKFLASACKYCRHYQPEGRRGGTCQQLGAPVQATWKACSLALPPFAPSWETLEDAWTLPDARPVLACSHSPASDLDRAAPAPVEEITASIYSEEAKTKAVFI